MLKFNVNDEMPHKASRPASVVSASTAAGSSTGTLVPARAYSPAYITTPSFLPPMSMGAIPPPPILFPSPPRTPLVPMDVDTTPVATPLSRASSTIASASTVSSCCEVSQKKEELQGLLTSFIRDFDRIATSTFGSSTASTPAAPTAPQKPPKPWKDEFALGTSAAAPRSLPVPPKATGTRKASEEAHVVHRGVLCDGCNTTIKGSRHKCMQCRGPQSDVTFRARRLT
jgi:next-to-BRCA1 protein 1